MTKVISDTPTVATPKNRECVCGNPIYPYSIGDLHYFATLCPDCVTKRDEEEEKAKAEDNIVHLGYQRRYAGVDFDNLHDPKPSDAVIEACRVFAEKIRTEEEPSGRGLYLWGPNGTGKTHLAVAITRHYGHSLFVNTLRLFDALKESYSTNLPCEVFESARRARLLVLDDLGSERPSDWVRERLYALLSTRWDEMLSTVVTSNIDPRLLPDIIGHRSASRVLGSSLLLKVDGPDHRLFGTAAV